MSKKFLCGIVVFCILCLLLKLKLQQKPAEVPRHKDAASVAKEWGLAQGKLVVMKLLATTTSFSENRALLKETERVAYVHDGSADIIIDLTKAEFRYAEEAGTTNLIIVLPDPKLDESTVGINPKTMCRVRSVPSARFRSQQVEEKLIQACRTEIVEREKNLFESVDVLDAAKRQARIVLSNLYSKLIDTVDVTVEFRGDGKADFTPEGAGSKETGLSEGGRK